MIPEDPPGYSITYTDNGKRFAATCLADGRLVGEYDTREAAVEASVADDGFTA